MPALPPSTSSRSSLFICCLLRVIIKTINDLDVSVSFPAKFKAYGSKKEYNLNCQNVSVTDIECYTEKDVIFDLKEKYYTYTVYNATYPNGEEIVDPYAKSTGVNGLRGMIVNFADTNPDGWDTVNFLDYDRKELVVWETHVADVTSSSTWTGTEANRKKFLGLIESGTTYTLNDVTVKTGFDHILELGVNAIQLIPIFDQANDELNPEFNWGYNPLNYNSLEGVYSSNPYDGYTKIREFKEVVKTFNEAGIHPIYILLPRM